MNPFRPALPSLSLILAACIVLGYIVELSAMADPLHFVHPRSEPRDLVVEGKSIGHVALGEDLNDVIQDLGAPSSSDAAMGKSLSTWSGHGGSFLQVYAARNFGHDQDKALVHEIRTNSPVFRTIAGQGVGTPLGALTVRYGYLKTVGTYGFNGGRASVCDVPKRGVAFDLFSVHGAPNCIAVTVHVPGEDPTRTYLPIFADFRPSN